MGRDNDVTLRGRFVDCLNDDLTQFVAGALRRLGVQEQIAMSEGELGARKVVNDTREQAFAPFGVGHDIRVEAMLRRRERDDLLEVTEAETLGNPAPDGVTRRPGRNTSLPFGPHERMPQSIGRGRTGRRRRQRIPSERPRPLRQGEAPRRFLRASG